MTSVYEKMLLAQLGDQTDILWKFYSPAYSLWSSKTIRRVLGYTTAACAINRSGKLIYLHAYPHELDGMGLIDKPDNNRWSQLCVFIYVFIFGILLLGIFLSMT